MSDTLRERIAAARPRRVAVQIQRPDQADGPQPGAAVITSYFRTHYQPAFKDGTTVHCADGREVTMREACSLPDSVLIDQLAQADDVPRYAGRNGEAGGIKRHALPGFFRTWAPVAWGDLLASLPDEDSAAAGESVPAGDRFRRLVREALLNQIVLGDVIGKSEVTQTERRSLIDWCQKFAKPGPWRSIRSFRCWCKFDLIDGGELVLRVAIRHELLSQLRADKYLTSMGANTFGRRAAKYGVGSSSRECRPQGQSAVVLDPDLVADLLDSMPADEEQAA